MKKLILTLGVIGSIIGGTIFIKNLLKENNEIEIDTDDKLANRMTETGSV